jgi:5-methylcytosine-specific restriction endonuclease McrA
VVREIVDGKLRCSTCKEWRNITNFSTDKSRNPPYKHVCKRCTSAARGVKSPTLKSLDIEVPKGHAYCKECKEIKPTREFVQRHKQKGTCKNCATPEQIAAKRKKTDYMSDVTRRKRSEQHGTDHEELDLPSIYAQFNNVCAYCGKKARLDADHFVPISRGGGYVITNIVPSCLQCNAAKNDSDPADWLVGRTDLYYSILNYFFQYMTEDQIYNKFNSGEWKVL